MVLWHTCTYAGLQIHMQAQKQEILESCCFNIIGQNAGLVAPSHPVENAASALHGVAGMSVIDWVDKAEERETLVWKEFVTWQMCGTIMHVIKSSALEKHSADFTWVKCFWQQLQV